MNLLITLSLCLFASSLFAQTQAIQLAPSYTIYPCMDEQLVDEYQLTPEDPKTPSFYGYSIQFDNAKNHFFLYQKAECGNQCLYTSQGHFVIQPNQQISLTLTQQKLDGTPCEEIYNKHMSMHLGLFRIEQEANGKIFLRRQQER